MGERDPEMAERLARRAVARAKRAGVPEVACEALEVVGRCARLRNVAEAEKVFAQAEALACEHGLEAWDIRALHELGTLDLVDHAYSKRLQHARERALSAGLLRTAAVLDLQIGACHEMRFEPEQTLEVALRCEDLCRRLELDVLRGHALWLVASVHAQQGRREEMERTIARALELAGHDPLGGRLLRPGPGDGGDALRGPGGAAPLARHCGAHRSR